MYDSSVGVYSVCVWNRPPDMTNSALFNQSAVRIHIERQSQTNTLKWGESLKVTNICLFISFFPLSSQFLETLIAVSKKILLIWTIGPVAIQLGLGGQQDVETWVSKLTISTSEEFSGVCNKLDGINTSVIIQLNGGWHIDIFCSSVSCYS